MIVWLMTDMEGLAGVSNWEQCYDLDDASPRYQHALRQLNAEVSAAVAGCVDAGASEVRVLDGHGRNANKGLVRPELHRAAKVVWMERRDPLRWEGLDESVDAVAIIGQHAMAGTANAFLDHTQCAKEICRYTINGREHGELSQLALYAGAYGVPLVYASGDEALCAEARRLFPHVATTPTKRGLNWSSCELYDPSAVRQSIRRDIVAALSARSKAVPWTVPAPIRIEIEFAYTGLADPLAAVSGVDRPHPRTVRWSLSDPRDIFTWPSPAWHP
jgi:D-amino peptidase